MFQAKDENILARFEEAMVEASLASSTVVNYLTDLHTFLRWGQQSHGEDFSLLDANQEHIRLYRYHLTHELNRAASTANRHLMALRKFYAYAVQMGLMLLDPTAGVALVQDDDSEPVKPLSDKAIEQLIASAQQGTRASLVRRDTAILQLLAYTGLRVSEVVDLQADDLIFDSPGLRLRVGGNGHSEERTRYLPLSPALCKTLNAYLAVRSKATASDHLFLSQRGQPISNRTVQRIVRNCAKAVGLEGVSAQLLRRTFAANLYQTTNDITLVCKRLGHQHPSITAQYLAVHQAE